VAEIVRRWRALTGGSDVPDADRSTLVACSAGADSSALALALASVNAPITIAHILHDMRPCADAELDREAAAALASALGRPFVAGEARAGSSGGNVEALLRQQRYDALAQLARAHGCRAVATGHHADDQAETILMRLMRGAGPRGLRGILPVRGLGNGIDVVRPMLGTRRREALELCERCGWLWREDPTNADPARLRAAVRGSIVPTLESISPHAVERIASAAEVQRDVDSFIQRRAASLLRCAEQIDAAHRWERSLLAGQPVVVLGAVSRQIAGRESGGAGDTWRAASELSRVLRSTSTERKTCEVGRVRWSVDASSASCTARNGD